MYAINFSFFNISYSVALLVMNYFSFWMCSYYFTCIFQRYFAWYRILVWQHVFFFFSSTLRIFVHCLLAYILLLSFLSFSINRNVFFSLPVFKSVSSLNLTVLIMCLGIVSLIFLVLEAHWDFIIFGGKNGHNFLQMCFLFLISPHQALTLYQVS